MSVPAAWTDSPSDSAARLERPTPRELRADRAAAQQGLILRRSGIRCGGGKSHRYNLVYERYNQPVATNMELTAVEVWLGIRGTA
jgi:hypothetical protein